MGALIFRLAARGSLRRGLLAAVGALVVGACGRDDGLSARDQAAMDRVREQEAATEAAKPRIDPGVMQPYPSDYFSQGSGVDPGWGKKGIARINRLRISAAETVVRSPECGRVELSDLAERLSTPPDHPVVFVDCSSHYRFTVTEGDVGKSVRGELIQGLE